MTEPPGDPGVVYRPVPDLDGYWAGDDGSIWSFLPQWRKDPWRRLKLSLNRKTGYLAICVGNHTPHGVHRLVLAAFAGPCPPGLQCCHNNGVKTDNRPGNLRWDTPAANAADRVKHKRQRKTRETE